MARRIGYSDKKFYYIGSGKNSTFNMRMRVYLKDNPDEGCLRRAASSTLTALPEFAIRPYIGQDGTLYAEENAKEAAVFREDGTYHALGSDETNGYLFCFLLGEKSLVISFYHGLSDFVGNWRFIRTLLYYYARERGLDVQPDSWVIGNPDAREEADEPERFDPYSKYGSEEEATETGKNVLQITEPFFPLETGIMRSLDLVMRTEDILEKTTHLHTSFVPLLTSALGAGLRDYYQSGEASVVVSVAADLRRLFHCRTNANFSASLYLTLPRDTDLTQEEICADIRAQMDRQFTTEHFSRKLAGAIQMIRRFESSGMRPEEVCRMLEAQASPDSAACALTYPGRITLPPGYEDVISGFNMEPYIRKKGMILLAGDYGEEFRIRICQGFEGSGIAEAVAGKLTGMGVPAFVRDAGVVRGDWVEV